MKKLPNYISFVFLFSILFSFSVSAINSLRKAENLGLHSQKAAYGSANDKGILSEDLVFEENENDTEDDYQESAFLLVYSLNFLHHTVQPVFTEFVDSAPLKSTTPLYLSLQVIRI